VQNTRGRFASGGGGGESNVFGTGHRIRLGVASSNFSRFDRTTNTGGTITEETIDDAQPADNRVHHSPPSTLTTRAAGHPPLRPPILSTYGATDRPG
jgi:hypothetical protein